MPNNDSMTLPTINGNSSLFVIGNMMMDYKAAEEDLPILLRDFKRYIALLPTESSCQIPNTNISLMEGLSARNQYIKSMFLCRKFVRKSIMADIHNVGTYLAKRYEPSTSANSVFRLKEIARIAENIVAKGYSAEKPSVFPPCTLSVLPDICKASDICDVILPLYDGFGKEQKPAYNIFIHDISELSTVRETEKAIAAAFAICILDFLARTHSERWPAIYDMLMEARENLDKTSYSTSVMLHNETVRQFYRVKHVQICPTFEPLAAYMTESDDWLSLRGYDKARAAGKAIAKTLNKEP